jgi:hypothetical protein
MSTATVTEMQPRQLPLFEGHKVPQARLSFGGSMNLSLTSPEDVALVKALTLGAEGTVTFTLDGHDRPLALGFKCTGRGHRFRKLDEVDSIVSTHRISINDVREGDEDEDGE